jgi:predicted 3-demethylubiquinone-9 3-methyltransferase (glyoxalase superfamily)/uncharacterized protein YndB with AHSA1/START domain
MPVAPDAILQDHAGRTVLRFERSLRQPPERVWTALTALDGLRSWHPSPFELEPRVGGAVRYLPPDGAAFGDGEVTAYEPPRALAYTWGDDHLRFELEPHGDGTRLVLTHTFDDRLKAARDAAGWHLCLDALASSLGGDDAPAPVGDAAIPAGWRELNSLYEERFGIAADEATPPPIDIGARAAVAPLLMFTGNAEEAMRFYASAVYPSRIERIERYEAGEQGPQGTVKHASMLLGGQRVRCIDSPNVHAFGFTPAISLTVECETTDAVDRLFARLADGGAILMPLDAYPFNRRFGWLTDRFGVSWQVMLAGG